MLDGMDSFTYALVLTPALTELLPNSGIRNSPSNIVFVGSVLFALFLFAGACHFCGLLWRTVAAARRYWQARYSCMRSLPARLLWPMRWANQLYFACSPAWGLEASGR